MKRLLSYVPVGILTVGLLASSGGMAQQPPQAISPSPAPESGITRQQADDILNELREIRKLLERQTQQLGAFQDPPTPATGKLQLENEFSLGSNDAPVTIVEFTDYECPFCRRFESTTFAEIRKNYIETGKVRFIVRDLPLSEIHPNAVGAAEAAHCAGDQGKFWPMHDLLFSDAANLEKAGLLNAASSLSLDIPGFKACIENGKYKPVIQGETQQANALGINGTPSFVLGKVTGGEVSGPIITGAQPLSVFEAHLSALGLAGQTGN